MLSKLISLWDKILPVLAIIAYALGFAEGSITLQFIVGFLLIGSVLSAVHHSEEIAHRVGEPFGTIILAVSITIIEVALIISLMLAGGEKAAYLARDTVFAAVMIILNAIIGICILIGTYKHFEQTFQKKSVNTALVSLVAILILTLVLPNFTSSAMPSRFSAPQLFFVAFACLVIYSTFLYVQTIRHRNYFLAEIKVEKEATHGPKYRLLVNLVFLVISLTIVVLLAKSLSPTIEARIIEADLPQSLVGIIIATVVLLPEALAAIKAAYKNDIQTSLNLSFGSALAAIGLTIPSVAIVGTYFNIDITLGLDNKSMILLGLSIFTVMLSLSKGKTNIVYGVVLIVNFIAYLITTIFP